MENQKKTKIAIAQINPKVGAIEENIELISKYYSLAIEEEADIVVTPELSLTGYPLKDLANNRDFLKSVDYAIKILAKKTKSRKAALVISAPFLDNNIVCNTLFVLGDGEIIYKTQEKSTLFSRDKYNFNIGIQNDEPFVLDGYRIYFAIGNDMDNYKKINCDCIISLKNINFTRNSFTKRVENFSKISKENQVSSIHINLVGGQDEYVFDGGSFAFNERGEQSLQLARFKEDLKIFNFTKGEHNAIPKISQGLESLWLACVLSLKDYVKKTGFKDVVVGLSGGIDSAVVAAMAGDALGGEHVFCFRLPSRFTSNISNSIAEDMSRIWGMPLGTIPIEDLIIDAENTLKAFYRNKERDVTEENLQARIRGAVVLMSLSNKHNWLLLNTGNKSEAAAGYSTLYGDTCGGFSVLKDVYKTTIFELANFRNTVRPEGVSGPNGVVIPEEIIERPPSAELRENQKDEDSLPPYKVLDEVLERLIEKRMDIETIISQGYSRDTVTRIYSLLKRAEFKRRQEPLGFEFSERPFGSGWNMPVVDGFDIALPDRLIDLLNKK